MAAYTSLTDQPDSPELAYCYGNALQELIASALNKPLASLLGHPLEVDERVFQEIERRVVRLDKTERRNVEAFLARARSLRKAKTFLTLY